MIPITGWWHHRDNVFLFRPPPVDRPGLGSFADVYGQYVHEHHGVDVEFVQQLQGEYLSVEQVTRLSRELLTTESAEDVPGES